MSAVRNEVVDISPKGANSQKSSSEIIKDLVANELIFAVVGPAGSGTSWIAQALSERAKKIGTHVKVEILKASEAIRKWAEEHSFPISVENSLKRAQSLQNAGDAIRKEDTAGVAVKLISSIRDSRRQINKDLKNSGVDTEGTLRVYILDSLKHPAEVELLRQVYREAFCLVGVVCESKKRADRLKNSKCVNSAPKDVDEFTDRDEDAGTDHGQKVADTFHLADFFVDNTPDRFLDGGRYQENPLWDVNDQLARLFDILMHSKLVRPNPSETGMFHAYGAQLRSACLSRQVGAALMDRKGNVIASGTNEVPRVGGGVYGGVFADIDNSSDYADHRCAYSRGYCSNSRTAREIVEELVSTLPELQKTEISELQKMLKKTALGRLLEFSRAVHAEMDAILSAARQGVSPVGGRLFVTTFPCHYCARHIVAAGVDEVQYIEPYPKSRALSLHGDAIVQSADGWVAPSDPDTTKNVGKQRKVLFRPFTGVAPRMYRRAFLKDRKLKNSDGEQHFGEPEWASRLLRKSYKDIEDTLLGQGDGDEHPDNDAS